MNDKIYYWMDTVGEIKKCFSGQAYYKLEAGIFSLLFHSLVNKKQRIIINKLLNENYEKDSMREMPKFIKQVYHKRLSINKDTFAIIEIRMDKKKKKYTKTEFEQLYNSLLFFINPNLIEDHIKFNYIIEYNKIKCISYKEGLSKEEIIVENNVVGSNQQICHYRRCKYAPYCFYILMKNRSEEIIKCSFCSTTHLYNTEVNRFIIEMKNKGINIQIPCCDCFYKIEKYGDDYLDPEKRVKINREEKLEGMRIYTEQRIEQQKQQKERLKELKMFGLTNESPLSIFF